MLDVMLPIPYGGLSSSLKMIRAYPGGHACDSAADLKGKRKNALPRTRSYGVEGFRSKLRRLGYWRFMGPGFR